MRFRTILTALASMFVFATVAQAQVNVMGTPTYGEYTLTAGFTPDPQNYAVTAGGTQQSSTVAAGCNAGWIAATPDVRVHYTAGTFPLRFYVDTPGTDPTLAVNAPDGTWHCNDDTAGLMPAVDFATPVSGQYDIFVGTFAQNAYPNVTLYVTELPNSNGPGAGQVAQTGQSGINLMGTPGYGEYTVNSGFSPDPLTYAVTAGGTAQSSSVTAATGMPCNAGWVASVPDVRIHYTAGTFPLRFFTDTAGTDTTLAVNAPDGSWHCTDDNVGLHPVIDFPSPLSGQYDVFVGTYAQNAYPNVTLKVTELPGSNGPSL